MFELGQQYFPRSMKTTQHRLTENGAISSTWINVCAIFGILCLLQLPVAVDGSFANCTVDTYKISGVKYENITCSGLGLTEVPSDGKSGSNIVKLDISNNQISAVSQENFQYFTNLVDLDLSNNQISSIPSDAFLNLTSLQILNLGANRELVSLPSGLFDDTSLIILGLSYNTNFYLRYVTLFGGKIYALDISHMSLTAFPQAAINRVSGLVELDASYNNITSLASNSFTLNSLRRVSLRGNQITRIGEELLESNSLNELDLSHNYISSIDEDAFDNGDSLTNLNLSHNSLKRVNGVFEDLENIEVLDLSYNQLTSLNSGLFRDAQSITNLNLQNNNLTSLPTNIFSGLESMNSIDLSGNLLTHLSANIFDPFGSFSLDVSNNPFNPCQCDFRNKLYDVMRGGQLLNPDTTKCTKNSVSYEYLDYTNTSCTGNLGYACTTEQDCMVQHVACTNNVCSCQSHYYDDNGQSVPAGLCKPQVSLDYPCEMNDACETSNSECTGSPTKRCLCLSDYYDDSPLYLGGNCYLKLDLGGSCTFNTMCGTSNAECGPGNECICGSDYYDNNTDTTPGGECLPKLSLNSSCDFNDQCAPANSECTNNQCSCSTGYWEIDNSGLCEGPSSFYSCYPLNTSSVNILFEHSDSKSSDTECEEYCFSNAARYWIRTSGVCLCGNEISGSCCPKVTDSCNSRRYIGPTIGYVTSRMSVTPIPRQYVGQASTFSVTTTLSIIDKIIWQFGDSQTEKEASGGSSTMSHTYTYSGKFDLTIKACESSSSVCDNKTLPVLVQVPRSNLTTYITAHATASIADGMTDITATFRMGYDFEYYWKLTNSSSDSIFRKGCTNGWTAHRNVCLKLVTTPATFADAKSQCTGMSANLLKINFMEEIPEIITALSASSIQILTAAERNGGLWEWEFDNSNTIFSNDHLTSSTRGDCVAIVGGTGSLTTVGCSTTNPFACVKGPVDCPHGGELLSNKHCLLLASEVSASPLSWSNAQTACQKNYGGWLANITDIGVHQTASDILNSSSSSKAFIGLSDQHLDGYKIWSDGSSYNGDYAPTEESSAGNCYVTKAGNIWAREECSSMNDYFCEYSQNYERLTIPSYVIGATDVRIGSGEDLLDVTTAEAFTDPAIATEIILFPGVVFSKPGSMRYWVFHTINVGSGEAYDIALQIYRPSCLTDTFIPGGCNNQKFAECSASSPTCASNNCADNKHFCYLSNTCKFFNQSCTCNSEQGITTACASSGTSPDYTLIAQTFATIASTGENVVIIPAGDVSVQEHDIVGIQQKSGQNVVICDKSSTTDLDRQSTYNASQTGWLSKGDNFPATKTDVDMTCLFQGVYTETQTQNLTPTLGYLSSVGQYSLSITIIDTDERSLDVTVEEAVDDVAIIYPTIQETSTDADSLGTVYTEYNQEYNFTVRVGIGNNLRYTFDSSAQQTFQSICPESIQSSVSSSDLCNSSLVWSDLPYSYVPYNTSVTGTANKTLTVSNSLGTTTKYLTVQTEKRITGMTFKLHSTALIANTVPINTAAIFETSYTDGTNISHSYKVDGVSVTATTSTLTHTFTSIGTNTVSAYLTNILGQETLSFPVYVKEPAGFTGCKFVGSPYVAVINTPLTVSVRCTVNIGAEVTPQFTFSDDGQTNTLASVTTSSTLETWTFDKTFNSTGANITITSLLKDPFENTTVSSTVDVYNPLPYVGVAVNASDILLGDDMTLTATVPASPGNYGDVIYTVDYGDSSSENNASGSFTHNYTSDGSYTINVTASSGPSSVHTTKTVSVYTEVDGLTAHYNGPNKQGTSTDITVSNTHGNLVSFTFVSSEFNVTQTSGTYSHTFTSTGAHVVNVTCSNALSNKTRSLTVYVLAATEIIIEGIKVDGYAIPEYIESGVSKYFALSVIHYNASYLAYNWNFDGSSINTTSPNHSYTFTSAQNYTLNVTVMYAPENAYHSVTANICVQDRLSSASLSVSNQLGLPSNGALNETVSISITGTPTSYLWNSNTTIHGSTTASTLNIEIKSAGFYNISVTLANGINTVYLSKLVEVIEKITGVTIHCSSCTEDSGSFYTENGSNVAYSVQTITGTSLSYSWDFGDGNTGAGISVSHSYSTVSVYTITVSVSNDIDLVNKTVTVYVESALTSVTIQPNGFKWLTNKVNPIIRDHNIINTAEFKASVTPSSMSPEFIWEFDTNLVPIVSATSIGQYNYSTIGYKSCRVTARNKVNNVTSSLYQFYAIKDITSITASELNTGTVMQTTSTLYLAVDQNFTIFANSSQIIDGTVTYLNRIKKGTVLTLSSVNPTINGSLSSTGTYTLSVVVENSVKLKEDIFNITVLDPVTGPYINTSGGDGNITLTSSIDLFGGSTTGLILRAFAWKYVSAPSGQTFSSNNQNVTITPTSVGLYIVNLAVSSPVSSSVFVNFTLNVMQAVSGIDITTSLSPPDAVKVGTVITLNSVVATGTDLSYAWQAIGDINPLNGVNESFTLTPGLQALYNITLTVSNYVSSQSIVIQIYSLNELTSVIVQINSGAVYNSIINKNVATRGSDVTFTSDITNDEFVDFDWKVNTSTSGTASSFTYNFGSAGTFIVHLDVSNKISSASHDVILVIQDAVSNFIVTGCNSTYLVGTNIDLTSTFSGGTDVVVEWESSTTTTGGSTTVNYATTGEHEINVTASNYVSSEYRFCIITIQGAITNLKANTSEYKIVGHAVTFSVTGDYLSSALFIWRFSHGVTRTTSTPTLDLIFSNRGNYSLTVNVSNVVSWSEVSISLILEDLKCAEPELRVDGTGTTQGTALRKRGVEFAVTVSTNNCADYTSTNRWIVYEAGSCAENLTSTYSLPSDIPTNTPILQILPVTLPYNSYCIVFEISYDNTPVKKYAYFNITIVDSPLLALITGGDSRVANAGSSLALDGSKSHDPDNSTDVLSYAWSCSQTMNTAAAIDVCSKINALTVESATISSLTLTENDVFDVTLTVSATGRTSHQATQKITVVSSSAPVVVVECVSCEAYENYFISYSIKTCFKGTCTSGCNSSSTYSWTVTDTGTNTDITVADAQTTTGTSSLNLCLNADTLQENKSYKFRLEATTGSETGYAEQSLSASTKPESGSCTLSASSQVVPMTDKVNVTFQNWSDQDANTGLYYKIVASYGTDSYIVYHGTQPSIEFYLSPWPGTSYADVTVTTYVVNDHRIEVQALTETVSFTAPTLLLSQTDKVNYLVDQIIATMPTLANQNNPNLLVQYAIAALMYLNDQSENDVNTTAVRMAIRDLFAHALDGIPFTTINDVRQIASAMKYLSAYPDELSKGTLSKLSGNIQTLSNSQDSIVRQGHDSNQIKTDSLLETVAYMQRSLQSITSTSSDSSTLTKFGVLDTYSLGISSTSSTASYNSDAEMQADLVTKSINQRILLTTVQLKTLLANEEPINKTLNDGSVVFAVHASVGNIQQEYSQNGVTVVIPSDILDYTTYNKDSVYHITIFNSINPYNFGYGSGLAINTKTIQTGFHDLNGDGLSISNLTNNKEVVMYMFANGVPTYTIPLIGIFNASGYSPREGTTNKSCTSLTSGESKYMTVPQSLDTGTSIHVQILPEFSTSQSDGMLNVTLYKDSVEYDKFAVTQSMYSNNQSDHRDYTFYIPVSERASSPAFKAQLTSNHNVRVCVAVYYAKCNYFNTQSSTWDTNGCVPQEDSIPTVATCKCDHMTSYGSGLLLSPDQIDFTDLSNLDFSNNPVAIITCSIILGLYIILVVICRKMDLLDIKHISSKPLCGKDGSFKYEVIVFTGRQIGAGTSAHVGIQLHGSYWKTAQKHIYKEGAFQRNGCDSFIIAHDVNLGDVKKIRIWHDNTGSSPSWYLDRVIINDLQTDQSYYFYCQSWLTLETMGGTIHKRIPAAGAHTRNRFGHRFQTAMFSSLADKHLWLSLLNRPAQSRFTRVQRATCCVTLLFTFICVNAMWYGLLKKDNQDLGWESFSWEEIILAIVTNVMVLPLNIGLIFLFKKSRSKANLFETLQKPQTAQTIEIENYCENSQGGSFESRNTGEIPYDLDRESTLDSVPANTRALHRSRHVSRKQRENTDDSLDRIKRPAIAVTKTSRSTPLEAETSFKWSESDASESRPSTSSTLDPGHKLTGTKATAGTYKKRKTMGKGDSDELLADLDKLEKDLKAAETRGNLRSAGSRQSETSVKSRRLTVSELEGLDEILHSDDETGTSIKASKKTILQSKGARFNPRSDPRINGNGNNQLNSRGSATSSEPEPSGSGITAGLRPAYYSDLTMESHDIRHIPVHKEKCTLPAWCVYVAYVLCFILCAFSVIIVILYCFKFGADEALKWVLACLLSLVLSLCVVEPLKALIIALYMVAMFKNVDKNDEDDCIEFDRIIDMSHENIQEQTFEPISGFALIKATEEGRKIRRMKTIIRQFFAYMFYLWVIMVIVYVHFHYNSYLFNKYVETSFMNSTTTDDVSYNNISTIEEFWDWTENVFADTLHLQDSHTDEEHGFLLGTARMRLIRSLSEKCQASSAASSLGASVLTDRVCYGNSGFEEDTSFYGERWNESSYNKSWKYVYANELGGSDKLGYVATYSGGGYLQTLGTSYAETLTIIQDLKDKGWIDLRTRAIIFEFSFYSPGSDMTAVTALLVEFPLTGGVITSYEILSQKLLWFQENRVDPLMVMECILFLVVIYSCVHIALQIREKKCSYFKEFWHWYEMITTLATIVSIGMYMGCVIEATNTFNNFLDDQSGFTNFERTAHVHVGMRYLYAWLLFLLMYKVVKQLRFIKFLYVFGSTLSTAFGHILGAFLIYTILLLSYAQLGYLMFGRSVPGFETVGNAVSTLVVMIRGTFNFWPLLEYQPVFSHFYLYSYYAFVYGILVALVISILNSCYKINKSKMFYKDSLDMKDYEMIDFMMNRFKLWAGIKKQKPAFRRVRFPDLPPVSSRPSTTHSSRSSESTDSVSTTAFDPDSYEPYLKRMAGRLGPTWQLFLRRLDEIEVLDQEEQKLVTKTEEILKDLNLRCRINELERQGKEILSWKTPSSSKPPLGDSKQRQSQRLANRDNQGQKAPSTVTGATSRASATPPGKQEKPVQSKRPLSDQGVRVEQVTSRRSSVPEKGLTQKFLKSVKPSKPAWDRDS